MLEAEASVVYVHKYMRGGVCIYIYMRKYIICVRVNVERERERD